MAESKARLNGHAAHALRIGTRAQSFHLSMTQLTDASYEFDQCLSVPANLTRNDLHVMLARSSRGSVDSKTPSRRRQRKPWSSETSAPAASPPSIRKNGHIYNGKQNHQRKDFGRKLCVFTADLRRAIHLNQTLLRLSANSMNPHYSWFNFRGRSGPEEPPVVNSSSCPSEPIPNDLYNSCYQLLNSRETLPTTPHCFPGTPSRTLTGCAGGGSGLTGIHGGHILALSR